MDPGIGIRNSHPKDMPFRMAVSHMAKAFEGGYKELSTSTQQDIPEIRKYNESHHYRNENQRNFQRQMYKEESRNQKGLKDLLSGNRPISNGLSSSTQTNQGNNKIPVQNTRFPGQSVIPKPPIHPSHIRRGLDAAGPSKDYHLRDRRRGNHGGDLQQKQVLMQQIPRLSKSPDSNGFQNYPEDAEKAQRFFGHNVGMDHSSSMSENNTKIITDLVNNLRSPTLGELLINPNEVSLKQSQIAFPVRGSEMYSSERHISPPSAFDDSISGTSQGTLQRRSTSEQNLSHAHCPPVKKQQKDFRNGLRKVLPNFAKPLGLKKLENLQGVPSQNTFVYYSKDNLDQSALSHGQLRDSKRVLQAVKKIENSNPKFCSDHQPQVTKPPESSGDVKHRFNKQYKPGKSGKYLQFFVILCFLNIIFAFESKLL